MMRTRLSLCVAGSLFTLFVAGCGQPSDAPTEPATSTAAVESQAATNESATPFPALRLKLIDGSDYDLASHKGSWVVVNLWATWCAACVKEMPELSALHEAHENVNVLGLTYEQIEAETLLQALTKRPVSYPFAIIDPYDLPDGLKAPMGLPMTYLVDPQGNVAQEFLGPVTRADIERAIAAG